MAALQGKSLKDYVLERVMAWTAEEQQALAELESFLEPRIRNAEERGGLPVSAAQIFEETLRDQR